MNQYIKSILATRGWQEIEEMFIETINACKSPETIDEKLDNETYVREVRAKIIAAKTLQGLLTRIKIASKSSNNNDVSYK